MTDYKKEFTREFTTLSTRYGKHQVWSDFIIMTACAISNAVDVRNFDAREKTYLDCAKRYQREELTTFASLLSYVVLALSENPEQDFLGTIFGQLSLHNEWRGQFFTPYHVGKLMADINISHDSMRETIAQNGYATVCDPCSGAGCLLIAAVNAATVKGIKKEELVLYAQDVDMIAGLMCYIQLALLGCRAYVKIGNTLTHPMTAKDPLDDSYWITPTEVLMKMQRKFTEQQPA